MTLTTGVVLTETPVEEVDGAAWIDQEVEGHDFTIKRGTSPQNHNANLTATIKQPMRLRFDRVSAGAKQGVVVGSDVLPVPAGSKVVIYRKYTTAPATAAVAAFTISDAAGNITQVTIYRGVRWRRVTLPKRRRPS